MMDDESIRSLAMRKWLNAFWIRAKLPEKRSNRTLAEYRRRASLGGTRGSAVCGEPFVIRLS
jgi:hypothetical protein